MVFSEILYIQELAHIVHNDTDNLLSGQSQIGNLGYTDIIWESKPNTLLCYAENIYLFSLKMHANSATPHVT